MPESRSSGYDVSPRWLSEGAPAIAAMGLIAFLTVVDLFATQAILPMLAEAYGVGPAAMGLAVNACTIGMAVAGVAVALAGGGIDRRRGILASLVLLALPTALLAVAPDLASFAALRIVQGLLMATAFSLTLAYLGEEFAPAQAATAIAAYITGNVASNLFGRMISASAAGHFGLAGNFLLFAALNLLGAALVAIALHPSMLPPSRGRAVRNAFAGAAQLLRRPALRAALAIGFCILFAFIGTFTFVGFVLDRPPFGLGMMEVALVPLVFLPSIVTTPLAGRVARRLGAARSLRAGLALAALGLPALLSGSLAMLAGGLVLVGVGTFFAQATATGFVAQAAQPHRSAGSGLYLASYFLGGLVGTAVLGPVYVALGWPACVAGIALALAAAGVLAGRLRPAGQSAG